MLKYIIFITSFIISGFSLIGQNCFHKDLSTSLDFETKAERIKRINKDDSCVVTIVILNKSTKKIVQTLKYNSLLLYGGLFDDCNFVRAYSTKKNINSEVNDYDFCDLIIADLNF